MKHTLERKKIAGLFRGDSLSRGQRRFNREKSATARRSYVSPRTVVATEKFGALGMASTVFMSRSVGALRALGYGGSNSDSRPRDSDDYSYPAGGTNNLPVAYAFEISRLAANRRGDCLFCGSFGEHPLKSFRHADTGVVTRLRQCSNCSSKFSDLPKAEEPTNGAEKLVYGDLPDSDHPQFNDCPAEGCERMNVDTYVDVSDKGTRHRVCKCPDGHVFKPAVGAQAPTRLWLDRSQRESAL
jgi:hypothetical protein